MKHVDILRWGIRERNTDVSVIDFPVSKFPLQFADPKIQSVVKGDRGVSIVRTDSNQIITNAGSDYQLVPHREVLAAVESMFEANSLKYELYDIHTGGTKGNRMYVNYILPSYRFKVEDDEYMPFVQVQNSYDKFILFGLVTGLYRTACWNGNLWGTREMQFTTKKHVSTNISLSDIAWDIDKWIQNLGMAESQLERLRKEPLSETTIEDVLKKILPQEKDQAAFKHFKLLEEYVAELGNNKYALFNALTAYATHGMSNPELCKNYDKARQVQMKVTNVFLQPA